MQEVEDKKTPLQMRMEQLGKQLSLLSFGIISVISIIGLFQGRGWMDTFTVAGSCFVHYNFFDSCHASFSRCCRHS